MNSSYMRVLFVPERNHCHLGFFEASIAMGNFVINQDFLGLPHIKYVQKVHRSNAMLGVLGSRMVSSIG